MKKEKTPNKWFYYYNNMIITEFLVLPSIIENSAETQGTV